MSSARSAQRIVSMDQFRGYTVAGMLLVNFLGGYAVVHPVLKHNGNYFSYADTIMPSFLFACGFSYRLSALRRLARDGWAAMARHVVGRSFALVLVSLVFFGFGAEFGSWSEITPERVLVSLAKLIKANLWEVLAIIGVAQLLALPVVAAGPRVRVAAIVALLATHLALTYAFNFDFVSGRPNRLDDLLGIPGSTAWDGGVFGLLQWAAILLAGSLAYDLVASRAPRAAAGRLAWWGTGLMVVGYLLSCGSTLYDGLSPTGKGDVAPSPVVPPLERLSARPPASLLAEPPFVQPPGTEQRPNNYWMMNKRIVTLPFVLTATGFAAALYGAFVLLLEPGGRGVGLFRTFGQNALAAYLLHHVVESRVHALIPEDSPPGLVLAGLLAFYLISYAFVRSLEKQGAYIRL